MLQTAKDLWDSIRLSVFDRLTNPLVGAFAIAWALWNFRILLVIFGEGTAKTKLELIDRSLMPTPADWVVHGYVIPLSIALAWVFILPFVFRKVLVFHREQMARTAAAIMIADGTQPISAEEATRIRKHYADLQTEWDSERSTYLKNAEELSQRIAELQKTISDLNSEHLHAGVKDAFPTPDLPAPVKDDAGRLVADIGELTLGDDGEPLWPLRLGDRDLQQLPSSLVKKIKGHAFQREEVQGLLAMRNWQKIDRRKLAAALSIEEFDAQVVVDTLDALDLIGHGTEGPYLNADARMLTAFFKRALQHE